MPTYLIDDIGTLIQNSTLAGIPGSSQATASGYTLCKGFMPPTPDKVVCVFETGGLPPDPFNVIDRPAFQVRVRAGAFDYATARAKIWSIFTTLHVDTPFTVSTRYYPGIQASGDVMGMGTDTNNRPSLAQNFLAIRSRTT